ncbi:MAG: hypothetical protein ABI562_07120 [Chloroflexota bacterium]
MRVLLLGSIVSLVAACGTTDVAGRSFPAPSIGPDKTVSPAVSQTRLALVQALGQHNLVLSDTQAPVRPPEAPLLTDAPRAVYQVLLPKDPSRGFVVVYEFPDPDRAAAAAMQEQAYLATGPARVQTPPGTVSIIRGIGSTVVFYAWLPDASLDPSAPGIQSALETLGVGYPVPS